MSLPKTAIAAVLTGDIVNSTKLLPSEDERLIAALKAFLREFKHVQFFRGDSFQVYLEEPAPALRMALTWRALAIGITEDRDAENVVASDIRISIGIGEVSLPILDLGSAKGDAFLLSGRWFDKLQASEHRLAITCGEPVADIGFEVISDYLDSIYKGMTAKQANVIVSLLQGTTQQQLATTLNKSKSTISQLANTGRWTEIEKLLLQYEQLIKNLS
jgi:hypothetical protein